MGWVNTTPYYYMELRLEYLRVGNYVIYEKTTHVVISLDGINKRVGTWWVNHNTNMAEEEMDLNLKPCPYIRGIEFHEGIPITIEELKRLDMQYGENLANRDFGSNYDYIFYFGSIRVRFFKDGMYVYTQGDGIKSIVEIKYVHELQNIVYFLYKKELIYKEILAKTS